MPRNSANGAAIADRRRTVARLRLRGLTQREIQKNLAEQEIPVALGTVNRDIKHLEAEWKTDAVGDIAKLKGIHVAELREVRRKAWAENKLYYVLKSLEQEARVLGLEGAPEEDITDKLRAYLDMVDAARKDAADLSE